MAFQGNLVVRHSLHAQWVSPQFVAGLTAIGPIGALHAAYALRAASYPTLAKLFTIVWLALSIGITLLVTPRNFTAGFLGGLFCLLVGWRIAGLHGATVVTYPLLAAFAAFALQFFDTVRNDLWLGPNALLSRVGWQIAFIRTYIGFDLIPHFTEKLFAGPGPFMDDVKAFAGFGLPFPAAFVILAGLCELAAAIGIGMGLLTRLAAACAALYFLIATLIGGHFGLGFIWASPGGGWEYPVLMMALFLTFLFTGGGAFSLDRVLQEKDWVPPALRRFI